MGQGDKNKDCENLIETSNEPHSSGNNNMKAEKSNGEAENVPDASTKAESSKNATPKSLKARSKYFKQLATKKPFKAKNDVGPSQVLEENGMENNFRNIRRGYKEARKSKELDFKDPSEEENVQKNVVDGKREENAQKNISKEKHVNKVLKNVVEEKHVERYSGAEEQGKSTLGSKKIELDHKSGEKRHRDDRSSSAHKDKGKLERKEESLQDVEKKEKLGGLIFMCNAKTKPDCYRYHVMGVSTRKKDIVLDIKHGLKLFLYDYDLKLMYGIYEATSSGGMKLEPKAFGGSFPFQVRFGVYEDCFPLPESVFKKAISYNNKNKFDTELSHQEVKKLSKLFRPVALQPAPSAIIPIHSPQVLSVRDQKVHDIPRESSAHVDRKTLARAASDSRINPVHSHLRDRHSEQREHKDEDPCDLYMSEKEYRTYGLKRERRNSPPRHVGSTLDPSYQRDKEWEYLLRQQDHVYRDNVLLQRTSPHAAPPYLGQREIQTYGHHAVHEFQHAVPSATTLASAATVNTLDSCTRDSYNTRYCVSPADAYLQPPRTLQVLEDSYYVNDRSSTYLAAADPLRPRETNQTESLYARYGARVSSTDELVQRYLTAEPEAISAPVSSRYTFAGPAMFPR